MIRQGAFAAALSAAAIGSASAQSSVEEFYKGKSISVLIGYAAGGTYDATARLLSRHMPRHIPGHPAMVPQNMPGSGGIKTILHLYSVSAKDGTALAMMSRSYPIEPVFNPKVAKYRPERFNPIGSSSTEVSVGVVWHTHGIKSLKDLQAREITVGATGTTDDTGRFSVLTRKLTGSKIKIVTGYPGGNDVTGAMEKGEVDGRFGWSWGSVKSRAKPWLDEKKINILIQVGLKKASDLPDIPVIMDFAKSDLDKKALQLLLTPQSVAWPLIAPPDVPKERVTALRRAFDATMKDPAFLAEAKRLRIDVEPVTGEEMQKVVEGIAHFDRKIIDRALDLTKM